MHSPLSSKMLENRLSFIPILHFLFLLLLLFPWSYYHIYPFCLPSFWKFWSCFFFLAIQFIALCVLLLLENTQSRCYDLSSCCTVTIIVGRCLFFADGKCQPLVEMAKSRWKTTIIKAESHDIGKHVHSKKRKKNATNNNIINHKKTFIRFSGICWFNWEMLNCGA